MVLFFYFIKPSQSVELKNQDFFIHYLNIILLKSMIYFFKIKNE